MSDEEIIEELTYKLDMTEHQYFELMDKYNKQKEEIEALKEHNKELAKFILNSGLEIIKSDKKDMIIDKDKFAKFKIE